jgi:hypothetical protein
MSPVQLDAEGRWQEDTEEENCIANHLRQTISRADNLYEGISGYI